MPRPRVDQPSLCHHKPTGLAYVRFPGCKPVYCGRWGTPEAKDKYAVLVAERILRGHATAGTGRKGITSSAAATNGRRLSGLAVGATTETVVVKYTCNGDATLDGIINADD